MNLFSRLSDRYSLSNNAVRFAGVPEVAAEQASNAIRILLAVAVARLAEKGGDLTGKLVIPRPHRLLEFRKFRETRFNIAFGAGATGIVAAVSRRVGFDAGPLAEATAVWLVRELRRWKLDSRELLEEIARSRDEDSRDPELKAAVEEAGQAERSAEAWRSRVPEDQWTEILLAPMAAYCVVAGSSLSGPRGSFSELNAAHRAGREWLRHAPSDSLLAAVFGAGLTGSETEDLKRPPETEDRWKQRLGVAMAAVRSFSPAEAENFRCLIVGVAENVAAAAKEGGFFGLGGKQVTEKERKAIDVIRQAVE